MRDADAALVVDDGETSRSSLAVSSLHQAPEGGGASEGDGDADYPAARRSHRNGVGDGGHRTNFRYGEIDVGDVAVSPQCLLVVSAKAVVAAQQRRLGGGDDDAFVVEKGHPAQARVAGLEAREELRNLGHGGAPGGRSQAVIGDARQESELRSRAEQRGVEVVHLAGQLAGARLQPLDRHGAHLVARHAELEGAGDHQRQRRGGQKQGESFPAQRPVPQPHFNSPNS